MTKVCGFSPVHRGILKLTLGIAFEPFYPPRASQLLFVVPTFLFLKAYPPRASQLLFVVPTFLFLKAYPQINNMIYLYNNKSILSSVMLNCSIFRTIVDIRQLLCEATLRLVTRQLGGATGESVSVTNEVVCQSQIHETHACPFPTVSPFKLTKTYFVKIICKYSRNRDI